MKMPPLAMLLVLLGALPARADRGALSVDLGGGAAGLFLPAPFADPPRTQFGSAFQVRLGARYAVFNWLEVTGSAFFEPPVTYFHNDVTVVTPDGRFPGTLKHQLQRYGALAGARYVYGMVWRFIGELQLGWSHRGYDGLQHINDTDPANPFDYHLGLPSFSIDNFVVAPSVGVEWAFADHWSVALIPRAEFLLGPNPTIGLSAALLFSYSWYL